MGAVPWAYLVVRWAHHADIRALGSGNVGALNAYRLVGPAWAAAVLLLDAAKGASAIGLARALSPEAMTLFGAAVAVVAGHNWPVFLGFRGGRGAATVLGVSLALMPAMTVASMAFAVAVGAALRSAVAGIAAGFVLLDLLVWVTGQDMAAVALCLLLTAIVGATYAVGQRHSIVQAIRSRRWSTLLLIE